MGLKWHGGLGVSCDLAEKEYIKQKDSGLMINQGFDKGLAKNVGSIRMMEVGLRQQMNGV